MAKRRNDAAIDATIYDHAIESAICSGKLTVLHPDRVPQPPARPASKAIKVAVMSNTEDRLLLAVGISKQAFRDNFPFVLTLTNLIWRA